MGGKRNRRPAGELKDFGDRLQRAREEIERKDRPAGGKGTAFGVALRISSELIVAVVVGTGMGWLLDRWLGTVPLFLLIFFTLGTAAGIRNVMRSAQAMQDEAGAGTAGGVDEKGRPENGSSAD